MTGPAARLGAETLDAGRSVLRLLRFDPHWDEQLDLTADGFLRSFWAPVLALPLNVAVTHVMLKTQGATAPQVSLFGTAIAHLADGFGYPLALALLARATGIVRGYAAFVILANWAGLFLNVALGVLALPLLVLVRAPGGFSLIALLLSGAYLFALWRAGRETIGRPTNAAGSGSRDTAQDATGGVAPVLMAVVLSVGVGAAADQLGAWLSG